MRFVDAHLHTEMTEDAQLQKLVVMGMEAAVVRSPHMFLGSHDAVCWRTPRDFFRPPID